MHPALAQKTCFRLDLHRFQIQIPCKRTQPIPYDLLRLSAERSGIVVVGEVLQLELRSVQGNHLNVAIGEAWHLQDTRLGVESEGRSLCLRKISLQALRR